MRRFWLPILAGAGHALQVRQNSPDMRCSLDDLPILCKNGSTTVLMKQNSGGPSQRKLRFGDECVSETTVTCAGRVAEGSCAGGCGPCPCAYDAAGGPSAPYIRTMYERLGPWCGPNAHAQVLVIGLGGGELPQYLLHRCPGVSVEAAELDESVILAARNFFGLGESEKRFGGRISVQHTDGLTAVKQRKADAYDVVLVDCFASGGVVPESCRSRDFAEHVQQILKPSGVMLQNMWTSSYGNPRVSNSYEAAMRTYGQVFGGPLKQLRVPAKKRPANAVAAGTLVVVEAHKR